MSYRFDTVCWVLNSLYLLLGAVSVVQLSRLQKRNEGISCSWGWFQPATVQQLVHLIILGLCAVRAAFFICAIHSWDPTTGSVYRTKVEFYSLDEVSNTLFFSLTSILALFWAELYYISIDRADIYMCIVRPVTYIVNFMAFVGVIVLSCMVSQYYADDVDYMFLQYTFLVTSTYLIAAVMFAYYAYMAGQELEKVPLPLMARRDRLFSLRVLAIISIVALVLKGTVVIIVTQRSMVTDSFSSLFLVFFYFFFCEVFPICIILAFYRVESWGGGISPKDENYYSGIERHVTSSGGGPGSRTPGGGVRTPQSASLLRSQRGEQPDVLEAIIARLSLETGQSDAKGDRSLSAEGEREELLGMRGSSRYQNLSL